MKTMSTVANQARRLNRRHRARARLPALALMTDTRRLPDPGPAAARLPPGSLVIFRHYGDPERLVKLAALARLCRRRRLRLLVAGDARLARAVGAAGVHLPEALVPRARLRRPRRDWLLTTAAHSTAAVVRARRAGADAVLLAPVFPTLSHPGGACLGTLRFAALIRASRLPVYALGGVNAVSARRLAGSGAVGVAAIGALLPAAP
jgi:thiamine-phosphate pyrophosphorylase